MVQCGHRPGSAPGEARGVDTGRKPKIDATTVRKLRYREKLGLADIVRRLSIGRASVYCVLSDSAAR